MRSAIAVDGQEVVPLGGISQRPTLLCNEGGEWISYRSDRRGFNNPDSAWDSPHLDVVALGDSFAHGYCVPDDRNFVTLIRRHHPATLNLGMAGDGPLLMLATLVELAAPRTPRIVLWFYYEGDDLADLQVERSNAVLSHYLEAGFSQPALARHRGIDDAMLAQLPRLEAIEQQNEERWRRSRWGTAIVAAAKLSELRTRLGLVEGTEPGAREAAHDFDTENMRVFREILQQAKARVDAMEGHALLRLSPGMGALCKRTARREQRSATASDNWCRISASHSSTSTSASERAIRCRFFPSAASATITRPVIAPLPSECFTRSPHAQPRHPALRFSLSRACSLKYGKLAEPLQ